MNDDPEMDLAVNELAQLLRSGFKWARDGLVSVIQEAVTDFDPCSKEYENARNLQSWLEGLKIDN